MISLRTSILLCGLAVATPVLAHHSANMFDPAKQVVLDATVKEFQWSNPHIWIQVMVPNAKGVEEEWSIGHCRIACLLELGQRHAAHCRINLRVRHTADRSQLLEHEEDGAVLHQRQPI